MMRFSETITQIAVRGSSGETPSGAMQFEDDWPGLFIRGDDAIMVKAALLRVQEQLHHHAKSRLPEELQWMIETIDNVVIQRPGSDSCHSSSS